jgi:predicted nicotinamide N-methyase
MLNMPPIKTKPNDPSILPLLSSSQAADPQFIKLIARIESEYTIEAKSILIGQTPMTFYKPADVEAALIVFEPDPSIAVDDPNHPQWQPYWVRAWESSIAACHELARFELKGRRVLDLGCGIGFAGAYAASQQATSMLADAVKPALLFAQLNVWPWRNVATIRQLNWITDRLEQRFDIIVGADIIYDLQDWQHLIDFWMFHLEENGIVLLTEPTRRCCDSFQDWSRVRGWASTQKVIEYEGLPAPVRVIQLKRSLADNNT